jgi:DNA-binding CsgD family transcriptional regulator
MTSLDDIVGKRLLPGILIFDLQGTLLFMNKEAESVVPVPRPDAVPGAAGKPRVPEAILELLETVKGECPAAPHKRSETRYRVLYSESGVHFYLRAFLIHSAAAQQSSQAVVLVEKVIERHRINVEKAGKRFNLSKREMEVLKHLCKGLSNKEISDKLFICEYTVKDHIKKIMKTMAVTSRSEIIASLVLHEA